MSDTFLASDACQALIRALANLALREHYHCDDSWYCCGKCLHPDHSPEHETDYVSSHDGEAARESGVCNCLADAHNAEVNSLVADLLAAHPQDTEKNHDDQVRVAPLKAGADGQDLPRSGDGG